MEINTLSIENFRGINSDKLPIKKVNVIIGENGSGKTSFLEAVFLFTSVDNNFIHLKYLHLLSPPYLTSTLGCKGCYILGRMLITT